MELTFKYNKDTKDRSLWFDANTIIASNPFSVASQTIYIHIWDDYKQAPIRSNRKYELTKKDYLRTMYNFIKDYKQMTNKSLLFISSWEKEFAKRDIDSEEEELSDTGEESVDQ